MFCSQVFTPIIKEAWHTFRSCAMPLLLVIIILTQTNSYLRALATLCLSGTVGSNFGFDKLHVLLIVSY